MSEVIGTKELLPYFPPLHGDVSCHDCEINVTCPCCGKYQRHNRYLTYESGRCPRLPDKRGFVEVSFRALYAVAFPLIHAEHEADIDVLFLNLTIPSEKRKRRVYRTRSGYWYYSTRDEYDLPTKRVVVFDPIFFDEDAIRDYMKEVGSEYCIFRAEITNVTV